MRMYCEIVCEVLKIKGIDILLEKSKLVSCLMDMSEMDFQKENRLISRNIDENILKVLYEAGGRDENALNLAEKKVSYYLMEDAGLSREITNVLVRQLTDGIRLYTGLKIKGTQSDDNKGRTRTELDLLTEAADSGNAEAQFNLGQRYAMGDGVAQNDKEAVKWFRKAAEQGIPKGQARLGLAYFKGLGVKEDRKTAFEWFRKAAENGDGMSMLWMGYFYENGVAAKRNIPQAVVWYMRASQQGKAEGNEKLISDAEERAALLAKQETYGTEKKPVRNTGVQTKAAARKTLKKVTVKELSIEECYAKLQEMFEKNNYGYISDMALGQIAKYNSALSVNALRKEADRLKKKHSR